MGWFSWFLYSLCKILTANSSSVSSSFLLFSLTPPLASYFPTVTIPDPVFFGGSAFLGEYKAELLELLTEWGLRTEEISDTRKF